MIYTSSTVYPVIYFSDGNMGLLSYEKNVRTETKVILNYIHNTDLEKNKNFFIESGIKSKDFNVDCVNSKKACNFVVFSKSSESKISIVEQNFDKFKRFDEWLETKFSSNEGYINEDSEKVTISSFITDRNKDFTKRFSSLVAINGHFYLMSLLPDLILVESRIRFSVFNFTNTHLSDPNDRNGLLSFSHTNAPLKENYIFFYKNIAKQIIIMKIKNLLDSPEDKTVTIKESKNFTLPTINNNENHIIISIRVPEREEKEDFNFYVLTNLCLLKFNYLTKSYKIIQILSELRLSMSRHDPEPNKLFYYNTLDINDKYLIEDNPVDQYPIKFLSNDNLQENSFFLVECDLNSKCSSKKIITNQDHFGLEKLNLIQRINVFSIDNLKIDSIKNEKIYKKNKQGSNIEIVLSEKPLKAELFFCFIEYPSKKTMTLKGKLIGDKNIQCVFDSDTDLNEKEYKMYVDYQEKNQYDPISLQDYKSFKPQDCSKGYYYNSNYECNKCGNGLYNDVINSFSCKKCIGNSKPSIEQTHCVLNSSNTLKISIFCLVINLVLILSIL